MTENSGNSAILDYGIVYFGNDWFAENRTSSHHIARRLAKHVPLLYVDSPGMRAPSSSARDITRIWRKLREAFRKPQQVDAQLWHCTVPQIPFRNFPGIKTINKAFGIWAVKRALRHVRITKCISWFVVPHPGFMAKQLDEALCIYYCIDNYAAYPGVDSKWVAEADLALTVNADHVFVASPLVLEVKKQQSKSTSFSPHGVDVELFKRAMDPATVVPAELRNLPRPIIGYFGLIGQWMDVELVAWLARSRPTWTFLLVGHVFTDVSLLTVLPNVKLVGPKPYEDLPAWAKSFDVAIIPFRMNEWVKNLNPLKLREYLATGKPVVTVSNAEIERFSEWVRIATSHEAFLQAIDASLVPEPEGAAMQRISVVMPMTWDNRVVEIMATVSRMLELKTSAH